MIFDYDVLDYREKLIFALRALYRQSGFSQYRMSKFEEYDLYSSFKDFLVSDRIITFNDTNGRLMALKPDVTLSIIKNHKDMPDELQKLCYNETVYRVSSGTGAFREILQAGLECIGKVDIPCINSVLRLAAESLALCDRKFALDISHLGIVSALIDDITSDSFIRDRLLSFAAARNAHDIRSFCQDAGFPENAYTPLVSLLSLHGSPDKVCRELEPLCKGDNARAGLETLCVIRDYFRDSRFRDAVNFDFSVISDMNYYNGIVFKGFLDGVPDCVLCGGQYDRLMQRMGRRSSAIGFAVYLDAFERFE